MSRLAGRIAIVTGAAGGIGAATARLFVEQGASIMLVDTNEQGLADTAASLPPEQVAFRAANVADADQVRAYTYETVERFGGLDIVVLNAGVFGAMHPVDEYPEDLFDRVVDINLKGVWHGLRAAIPAMRERGGGSVVITSSTQGLSGYYLSSAYTATKHGAVGIMRNAAVELAKENIRVNTVHPGLTDTDMMGGLHRTASPDDPDAIKDAFAAAPPIGRYAAPREIAQMMLFLAGDEASYCTGGCYAVDGGLLAYHGGPAPS